MSTRILVTCVGGTMAPDLLSHLRSDPILRPFLIGVDNAVSAVGRGYVDSFHQVPFGDAPGYVDKIVEVVRSEGVNLVLPASDQEAFVLAKERDRIAAAGAVVLASPVQVLDLIRDKWATYRALESAGLRVPEHRCVADLVDLQKALADFGYPRQSVIVKPIAGRGGRGMRLLVGTDEVPAPWIGAGARESRFETVQNAEQMRAWLTDGTLMVMPMLSAPAYDVDVFAVRGKARAALVRRRYNPAGIPFTGNQIAADPAIMDYCLEIAEALGLDALHDIDLMTDRHGRPCLLEVNPRPSGSAVAAHAAGFPIVACAIAETLGYTYPLQVPDRDIHVGMIPRATVLMQSSGNLA